MVAGELVQAELFVELCRLWTPKNLHLFGIPVGYSWINHVSPISVGDPGA